MNNQFVTNKYKRDGHSKALLANDENSLKKYLKQKELANKIKDQESHINNLEDRINLLETLYMTITENKKIIENLEK